MVIVVLWLVDIFPGGLVFSEGIILQFVYRMNARGVDNDFELLQELNPIHDGIGTFAGRLDSG